MSKKIAVLLGAVGFLASTGLAFAQTTTSVSSSTNATQPTVLEVNKAGNVLIRGTVNSVSANSLTIKSWGGEWTINVPSGATVLPQGTALSSFAAGDFVGVQGTVNTTANWTVDATLVRDWTARHTLTQEEKTNAQAVHTIVNSGPKTVQGTLSGLDTAAQTFTLTNASGAAFSVSLNSGAKILAKNWATLDFSKVTNGDTVRVYGDVSSTTIAASVFRDVTVK